MSSENETAAAFSGFTDLASERLGGKALIASDEFFAEKENLLKPGRGIFIPDKYTDRGKWMDGWESRRKRTPGHDWCIVKLGFSGIIKGVDIDTNHFLGNNPAYASIEACSIIGDASNGPLPGPETQWSVILPKSPLRPGTQNLFSVADQMVWTHVRLNIFPDGGVARLRIYGNVVPDWNSLKQEGLIDLAYIGSGGKVVAASDMFFGNKENLIMPGRAVNMGDGWETKRRRGLGHDWAILQLGALGRIQRIEVDTGHFKGNYPDSCSIDALSAPGSTVDALSWHQFQWKEILPQTGLHADTQHLFEKELKPVDRCTHVRLNVYPDGGVSRMRVLGYLASE
ncbi:MAG: allantoicase [Bacteroidetes bacterium]|nr:allantoicase [Bacteroidota bacterium]MCW5895164.1 allantoicase [Bacteroidota bacterium]